MHTFFFNTYTSLHISCFIFQYFNKTFYTTMRKMSGGREIQEKLQEKPLIRNKIQPYKM